METNCSQFHRKNIFFFCDSFGYDASEIERPGIILYNQVLLEEFLEEYRVGDAT